MNVAVFIFAASYGVNLKVCVQSTRIGTEHSGVGAGHVVHSVSTLLINHAIIIITEFVMLPTYVFSHTSECWNWIDRMTVLILVGGWLQWHTMDVLASL